MWIRWLLTVCEGGRVNEQHTVIRLTTCTERLITLQTVWSRHPAAAAETRCYSGQSAHWIYAYVSWIIGLDRSFLAFYMILSLFSVIFLFIFLYISKYQTLMQGTAVWKWEKKFARDKKFQTPYFRFLQLKTQPALFTPSFRRPCPTPAIIIVLFLLCFTCANIFTEPARHATDARDVL